MNPYEPPRTTPQETGPPTLGPWFQRACTIRTHAAHGSLAAALLIGAGGAVTGTEWLIRLAGFAFVVFCAAVLAVIPLTLIGLLDGFFEGRQDRRSGK